MVLFGSKKVEPEVEGAVAAVCCRCCASDSNLFEFALRFWTLRVPRSAFIILLIRATTSVQAQFSLNHFLWHLDWQFLSEEVNASCKRTNLCQENLLLPNLPLSLQHAQSHLFIAVSYGEENLTSYGLFSTKPLHNLIKRRSVDKLQSIHLQWYRDKLAWHRVLKGEAFASSH
jgi:hypothetical protein